MKQNQRKWIRIQFLLQFEGWDERKRETRVREKVEACICSVNFELLLLIFFFNLCEVCVWAYVVCVCVVLNE